MAKPRKPAQAPNALVPLPGEDATLEQRTKYLLQELGEEAGFLEQWIAHYLAELLKQAEDQKSTPRARSEARAEIARVIPSLWEQQIAREALRVRQKVDYWLRRTNTLDSEAEQFLAPLLAGISRVADVSEVEAPHAFRRLHTFAELVTRFSVSVATAEWARREVTSEAVRSFLHRDDELHGLQAALSRVVPDFAELDLTDSGAVTSLVHQTLLSLTKVQFTLLTGVDADPPRPRKARKVRA